MKTDPNQAAVDKTTQIFKEICPDQYQKLVDRSIPEWLRLHDRISGIISKRFEKEKADDFTRHVIGFPSDMAFMVALFLFPERFTDEEIAAGIRCFGIEASFHAVEIARMLEYIQKQ